MRLTKASPSLVLLVVATGVFLASLDLFIVNIAFPDIESHFENSSASSLSWILNGYTIVFAALLMPAGRIADRIGRKKVFLAGLLVFAVASVACAASWSVDALIWFRVIQGIGAAMLMATSLALLLHTFPPAKRPMAIGIWAAVGGVAAALGPPVGGILVEFSWRWVFLVNVPIGLAAWYIGTRVITESLDEGETRWPDAIGTAMLAIGVAAISWGLVEAPDWGWGAASTIGVLVAGVALLAGVVYRAARTPGSKIPVLNLELFRSRAFAMASLTGLVFTVAFGAMLLCNVLFLTGPWDYSVLKAGLSLAPGPAMAAITAIPAGKLGAKVGAGPLAALGSLVFALGTLWWITHIGIEPNYAADLLPGMFFTGIGVGLVLPNISAALASTLAPGELASGTAVLSAARQIGAVLGVAALFAVIGNPDPADPVAVFHDAWIFIALTMLASAACGLAIGRGEHPEVAASRSVETIAPATRG